MRYVTVFIALALSAGAVFAQDDLAKFQEHMKAGAVANMALRKGLTEKDAAAVTANAESMTKAFDWIGNFFMTKGKKDGADFAKAVSEAVKAAAAAKTPEEQTAALGKIGPACQGCHGLYRDKSNFKGL